MTLQDAHHDRPQDAFPEPPATPTDLAEMPTNPLMPSLLPANRAPITPTETGVGAPGSFAGNSMSGIGYSAPIDPFVNQAQPGVFAHAPTTSTNNEIIIPNPTPFIPVPPAMSTPPFASLPSQPPPLRPMPGKHLDTKAILSICAALLLLVLSAGGLIANFVYYQPYRLHAAATATGIAIPTTTARAEQTYVASYEHTQVAQQQATASAEQNIYTQAISGKPFLNDSLKQQSTSAWDEGVIWQNSSCTFENGSYVVYQPNTDYFLPCFAETPTFINFALQVDINVVQGDAGGVIFRGDSTYGDGYIFDIDKYGDYDLYKYTDKSANLLSGRSYDYQTDQKNRLTIIARGNTFYFYVNQHFVDSTTDKTFGEGSIGLIASDAQDPTTVAYNNIKVWLLY